MDYVVVYEKGEQNYGAYVPDLPGCAVVGATLEEVQTLIAEAIEFHIDGLRKNGYAVPAPSGSPVPIETGMLSAVISVQI